MSTAQIAESADLSTAELEDLEDKVSLPYTIENVTLMSPGTWNDIKWTGQEIEKGMRSTDFDEDHNNALFLDHEDRDSEQWIGRVENIRMDGNDMIGDLKIVDKETAIKLEFGAKFGISPKVTGRTDGQKMKNFEFDNFSVVVNPAVKTTFLNSELIQQVGESGVELSNDTMESETLQSTSIHVPDFDGTEDVEWEKPNLKELAGESSWDDLNRSEKMDVDDHFIVSKSSFPPEDFSDLALPVVSEDGNLNLNALQNAKARAGQVEGVDASDEEEINNIINRLANENFPDANFGEDEETEDMSEEFSEDMEEIVEELGTHTNFNERQFAEFVASIYNEKTGEVMESLPNAEPSFDERQLAGWLASLYSKKTGKVLKALNALAKDRIILDEDNTTENQDNNTRGDSTMSDQQESGEAETEASEMDADVDAIAQRVAEILEDDGDEEEAEDAESEAEEVENEDEPEAEDGDDGEEVENSTEVDAEASEFEEFVSEKMEQNPDMSYVEAAKEFERAQKSEAEKVREEVKEEMSQKIDELKSEIQELKTEDEETEAQRATQTLGEQREEVKEEVQELSDDELDAQIMKGWLSKVKGGAY